MLACWLAVLPRDDADLRSRLAHALGITLALLTLASFGILLSRTIELNGGDWGTLWHDMRLALTVTHFGHVWWWRVPALVVAWLAWVWSLRQRGMRQTWVMALAIAAIALTRSETGHPADNGDFTAAVWVDWLHLLAAGAWVGSLFGMTLVVFPKLLRAGDTATASGAIVFQRLSTLSGIALAVLVAAGIFNVTQQLGGASSLWTTRYGVVLDVKLAIVLTMIAIGAHNRHVKLPRLLAHAGLPVRSGAVAGIRLLGLAQTSSGPGVADVLRSCARAVLLESVLGLFAIGATGVLLHAMPPADAFKMQPMPSATRPDAGRPIAALTVRR